MVRTELRTSFHPPISSNEPYIPTFDNNRLNQVIDTIQHPNIVEAMGGVQNCMGTLQGEIGRLKMLSGAFHPDFYHKTINLLMESGVIRPGYSMIELGTSLAGHLPQIPSELQPGSFKGLDNDVHIVAGAQKALKEFERAGLLDATKYTIVLGDHTHLNRARADVAVLSLTSQYDGGEQGAVDWLMHHGRLVGINGDVVHTPVEISQSDLDSGILPVKSRRLPFRGGYTGFNWKLEGSSTETPFGQVYRSSILLDDEVYNPKNNLIQIPQPGAELEGKVTVFDRDGKLFAEPWAWELTDQATAEDVYYLKAIRRIFNEQYSQLELATDPPRVWDSNAGLGVPVLAAESGFYSVVMFNTATHVAEKSGMLPLAMLRRNGREVRHIFDKGLLSQIGPGKPFVNLGVLYEVIGRYLSNPLEFFSKVNYTNPLLVTAIITGDREIFEHLRAAA